MTDELLDIYERDNWTCQRCNKRATQIAHRISKGKVNHKYVIRYIIENYPEMTHLKSDDIIHHKLNMIAVCDLECNSSFNIGNNIVKANKLIDEIIEELRND